jgi:hypothetical protein
MMNPDTSPEKSLKNACLINTKKSELPEHMNGMTIDMSQKSVNQSLPTDASKEKTMSIDEWILDSMRDGLSPQLFSLFLMLRVKFVQFEQRRMLLLSAGFKRSLGTIENLFEPAPVQIQIVSDRDLL